MSEDDTGAEVERQLDDRVERAVGGTVAGRSAGRTAGHPGEAAWAATRCPTRVAGTATRPWPLLPDVTNG